MYQYYYDEHFDGNMRDENEILLLKTIKKNDVEALKKILKNPVGSRLGSDNIPILSVAAYRGGYAIIKHLIDSGCDSLEVDEDGRTALHLLFLRESDDDENDDEEFRLEIADILLATYSNPVEAVFLNQDKTKMTPFLSACVEGYDAIILRFLALIDTTPISMDYVIDRHGNNLFHYRLNGSYRDYLVETQWETEPTRLETVRALIDKFPYFDQLIDAQDVVGETPLHKLLRGNNDRDCQLLDLARLFFQHGASPDTRNKEGTTYLDYAIMGENESLFETLLRVGCRTDISKYNSPLSRLFRDFDSRSIRMIELLLAFGHDLQKELLLYSIDERPVEPGYEKEYKELCDTRDADRGVLLEALREFRRSNKMLSLQRQCRNTIRRHLKAKADEVISNLTCIPDRIKSFLLVENETPLLKIPEWMMKEEEESLQIWG